VTDALLRQVLDELRLIRQVLERRSRPRDQDDVRVRVLMAVVRVFGGRHFSTNDVIKYSRLESDQHPHVIGLSEAPAAADCDSQRALSHLFRRIEDRESTASCCGVWAKTESGWCGERGFVSPQRMVPDDDGHAGSPIVHRFAGA
jgi:hypothetical protein